MEKRPRWLEVSGLPQWLREQAGPLAWPLLAKLIEIDCRVNPRPQYFDASPDDLSQSTGLTMEETEENLDQLQELGIIRKRRGKKGLRIRIESPLPTPQPYAEVAPTLPGLPLDRYAHRSEAEKTKLEEVRNLYLQTFGGKATTYSEETLREISVKFSVEEIRSAFKRALERESISLSWILKRLYRRRERLQDALDRGKPLTEEVPAGYKQKGNGKE